jgi:transposase-like protein
MDFPLNHPMNKDVCYVWLVELLHHGGLVCPRCGRPDRLGIHSHRRLALVLNLDYQCGHCRRVFNAWPRTSLQGMKRAPSQIVLLTFR